MKRSSARGNYHRKKRVTIKDIASRLGLSFSTVSQALKDHESTVQLSEKTRARVRQLAAKLGYRHNRAAQFLRTGKTGLLGILSFQGIGHHSFLRLQYALEDVKKIDLTPLVYHVDATTEQTCLQACHAVMDAKVDGVLLLTPHPYFDQSQVTQLQNVGIPVTSIGGYGFKSASCYTEDRKEGFRRVTEHVIQEGCRSVMLLCTHVPPRAIRSHYQFILDSIQGFNAALRQARGRGHSIHSHTYQVTDEFTEEGQRRYPGIHDLYLPGYLAMWDLIRSKKIPDALVCQADCWAMGALRACAEANIRVPQEIAITGSGDDPVSCIASIPLTSITHPHSELSHLAVTELSAMIKRSIGSQNKLVYIPGQVVIRESSLRTRSRVGQRQDPSLFQKA